MDSAKGYVTHINGENDGSALAGIAGTTELGISLPKCTARIRLLSSSCTVLILEKTLLNLVGQYKEFLSVKVSEEERMSVVENLTVLLITMH